VRRRPIEDWLAAGDYTADATFRERFQAWLGGVWADKDALLDRLLA
jgi:hypothetical protein